MKYKVINFSKLFSLLLCISLLFSCSDSDDLTQEQEAERLSELFTEIENLASSVDCEDSSNWTFTPYGSKTCGGPVGFIAYSTVIDTRDFLNKIEEHRTQQENFNRKWGVFSDCSVPPQPKGIRCEEGKPVFEYE